MMSLPIRRNCKCSVCAEESRQTSLASTNMFGSPDLDLRPPEMKRSTMRWWIQECPHCGFVSDRIEKAGGVDRGFLESEAYRTCSGKRFLSQLAARFYKAYMINLREGEQENAFFHVLYAAWACDDAQDTQNATDCRKLAVEQIDKMLTRHDDDTLKVQKADLLRRAGMFETVIKEYSPSAFTEEVLRKVIAFQIAKAKEGDTACYTVADAVE